MSLLSLSRMLAYVSCAAANVVVTAHISARSLSAGASFWDVQSYAWGFYIIGAIAAWTLTTALVTTPNESVAWIATAFALASTACGELWYRQNAPFGVVQHEPLDGSDDDDDTDDPYAAVDPIDVGDSNLARPLTPVFNEAKTN